MKLASVHYRGRDLVVAEAGRTGALVDVADLGVTAGDMLDIVRGGLETVRQIADGLAAVRDGRTVVPRIDPKDVRWRPPVRPGKVLCVAMNNSASNARKISAPDHPAFFLKPSSCLVGHLEPIKIRRYYGSVHPEPELALVIGERTRDVPAASALERVFGYTIMNDITGNGMRAQDRFHYWAVYAKPDNPAETERVEQHLSYAARYKGTDTFGSLGPWLVTRDEVPEPDDLNVRCTVGGETVAEDSTRYYNYKTAEIVSFISYFHTLEPGDVLSLGTAFKPGVGRKSIHNADLQRVPGPIEVSIDGLGTQHNPVVIEEQELGPWRMT